MTDNEHEDDGTNGDVDPNEEVTILIADNNTTHRFNREVPVAVNGAVVKVPIGVEYHTRRAIALALEGASISFTEVEPKGETGAPAGGVSVGATSMIAGEGDIDEAEAEAQAYGAAPPAEDAEAPAVPELRAEGQKVHLETVVDASQLNTGDPAAGSTAHLDGQPGGANANGTGGAGGDSAGDTHIESADEHDEIDTSALDSNLADLKADVAKLDTVDAVDQHIEAEKAGKNRSGAIALLEARKAELAA